MERIKKSKGYLRKVLVVEDEEINRAILGEILKDSYEVLFAADGIEALDILNSHKDVISLVLLDLLMPRMDGHEFMERIREDEILKHIPVIVMTAEKDAEVKSIREGAADFITKPYDMPEVILARCERIIELSEDKTLISSTERDALTGLYSRDFFYEYVRQLEKIGSETADAVVLDIEHFHLINEMHGRYFGDLVLKTIAGILQGEFGSDRAIACRPESDTFYIYSSHNESYDDLLERLQSSVAKLSDSAVIRIRAGVYSDVDKSSDPEAWFDRAKTACDGIRSDYTRSISYYSKELYDESIYNEKLINEVDEAIERGDFKVYYQPKYNITGDTPVLSSAEALIRWIHPQLGMISPGAFVPLFERNGLVQKLDGYVWREAASQIRRWKEKFGVTVPVSVNVSRIDICDPELESRFNKILEQNGITTSELYLEITESAYADDARRLVDVVKNLRSQGFRIEMDDFGSGYSSLNMLTTIDIDVLKMDMKFVRNMLTDDKSLKMVDLVLDIAKFLGVPVVAEGVETKEQLDVLKGKGCEVIQGYYFSKPVPPEEFEQFIKDKND